MKKTKIFLKVIYPFFYLLVFIGCATPVDKRPFVSDSIRERVDIGLPPVSAQEGFQLPKGVSLDDGISEDEAIAIGLWNNAQFSSGSGSIGINNS